MTEKYWLNLVQNKLDFLWIYLNTFGKNNKTKKFYFLNMKLAFINIGLQSELL